MNQSLANGIKHALTAPGFETAKGYCSRLIRQGVRYTYGDDRYNELFRPPRDDDPTARKAAFEFRRQGKGFNYTGNPASLELGDILFKSEGSGGYGHVGGLIDKSAAHWHKWLVGENSSVEWNRHPGDARGIRTLLEFGQFQIVGRLPDPHPAVQPKPSPVGKRILVGDGTWPWLHIEVDGQDLVCRSTPCTWFGGDSDPQDDGTTASGVNTKGHPALMGCALPLRRDNPGAVARALGGSPLPHDIPFQTMVHVWCHETGKQIDVPLIDIGPAKKTRHGCDLTVAAFQALGVSLGRGVCHVDYRIKGGANYIK